jgi:endo-1,4-beta-D-glucanase Y
VGLYYKKFSNKNGLMNWRIRNFSTVTGANSATDAELDAAVGLLQAYKQWGDDKYLNDARALIDSISKWEVNKNGLLTPGDSWDSQKKPFLLQYRCTPAFKKVSTLTGIK